MSGPTSYSHSSSKGPFWLLKQRDGRWLIMWDSEALETHSSPWSAAAAVATGTCMWPSFGSPAGLGISEDLEDWTPRGGG